jgi:prepilin-type N-terminal cleavage/methylation domain-containing protein
MRSARRAASADEGFTLIEVMMSLTLIAITMAALGPFFTNSLQSVTKQRGTQSAVDLANSAMEQVRALRGSSLVAGRGENRVRAQWAAAPAVLKPYFDTMKGMPAVGNTAAGVGLLWDDPTFTATTLGDDAPVSTATQSMAVDSLTFSRTIYAGACDRVLTATSTGTTMGSCVDPSTVTVTDPTKDLKFFRVVVLVVWSEKGCTATGTCTYVASTLVSRAAEPTFDVHRPPPVVKTADATFYKGQAVSFQLEATGGQLPDTWTVTGLPAGLTVSTSGLITGTPTTVATYTSSATVKDTLARTDAGTVVFTIVLPPAVTVPANASNHVGEGVSQTVTASGGTAPYTYAATGLPPGLTLNTSTGAITGTVSTAGTYSVTVTMTDAGGGTGTGTYTHTVYPVLQLAALPDRTISLGSTFSATAVGSGGKVAYTYSATRLPLGVTMNPSTGVLSGLPTVPGRYLPNVTVTDSLGGTASVSFVLIVDTSSTLIFTSPSLAAADQTSPSGSSTSLVIKNNGSLLGLSPTIALPTGLPPGLTMNLVTGTISGTPTTPGSYVVNLLATNLLPPQTSNLTFVWTIT